MLRNLDDPKLQFSKLYVSHTLFKWLTCQSFLDIFKRGSFLNIFVIIAGWLGGLINPQKWFFTRFWMIDFFNSCPLMNIWQFPELFAYLENSKNWKMLKINLCDLVHKHAWHSCFISSLCENKKPRPYFALMVRQKFVWQIFLELCWQVFGHEVHLY